MKIISTILVYFGIVLTILAIAMFAYGIHMFGFRGEYTISQKNLGEFSFICWLPTLFSGLMLLSIGLIIKAIKRSKQQDTDGNIKNQSSNV